MKRLLFPVFAFLLIVVGTATAFAPSASAGGLYTEAELAHEIPSETETNKTVTHWHPPEWAMLAVCGVLLFLLIYGIVRMCMSWH